MSAMAECVEEYQKDEPRDSLMFIIKSMSKMESFATLTCCVNISRFLMS